MNLAVGQYLQCCWWLDACLHFAKGMFATLAKAVVDESFPSVRQYRIISCVDQQAEHS